MTYAEAIQFLHSLQMFGVEMGLDRARKLAALAGNPQDRLRFIHVAGTNGKGSTCAMLESIYRAAGLRVGLFTSPHLVAFGERIQVNRRLISEADVTRLVEEMAGWLQQFSAEKRDGARPAILSPRGTSGERTEERGNRQKPASSPRPSPSSDDGEGEGRKLDATSANAAPDNAHPTFFEVVTVMALRYFAEQKCDLVIWETGLGGRLDATNIVTPLASVITNIQLDHQAWLGDTLERIATEKAGIIKPGVPVITAVDDLEAFRVLFATARRQKSPFWLITWAQTERPPLSEVKLPFLGEHQRLNAAVALYTARAVADKIPVDERTIEAGLSQVSWPGRLQLVDRPGGQKLLLDGAHNIGSAEALRVALRTYFAVRATTLILGILRDKDCAPMCRILAPLATRILLVPVNSQRTASPGELVAACREANPAAEIVECGSLAEAISRIATEPFVVITGSLYLIGEAMELLDLSPAKMANERSLNEWNATRNPTQHEKPAK